MVHSSCRQGIYDDDDDDEGNDAPSARPKSETAAAEAATTTEFSALSPVQIVARGDVKIGYFDVSRFIKTVGPFAKVEYAPNHSWNAESR